MTLRARLPAWSDRSHDAFGRLLADPATLTREQRLRQLREAGHGLVATADPALQYLGEAMLRWLDGAVPTLEAALCVATPRGSHRTAAAIARQANVDAEVAAFAAQVGGPRCASAVLRGAIPCPAGVRMPEIGPLTEGAIRKALRCVRTVIGDDKAQRNVTA